MDKVVVDTTPSLKTLRITGRMSWLRVIEEETDTWAHFRGRTLELPAVRGAVDALRRVVPEELTDYTPGAARVISEVEKLAAVEEENLRLRARDQIEVEGYEFGGAFPPWDHQVRAFMLSRGREVFGLFMEMGTGKTRVVIDSAAYLFEQGEIDMCLIIAPNGVHRQWVQKEVPLWMPPRIDVHPWAHTQTRKEPKDLYDGRPGKLKFYAINIEQLSVASGKARLGRLLESVRGKRTLLVVDESSMIKWHRAARTQTIEKLGVLARYRRILDGLPVSKGVQDIYAQFRFLDPNIIGVTSFTGFRNRYCRMGGFENRVIVGYKNVGELMNRVQGHTFRVRKEDCLDLPKKMPPVEAWVELTDEQRKYYRQMKENFFMEIERGEIVDGSVGAVRLMRMHQVVCGHLPRTKKNDWRPLSSNRIDRLVRLLDQVDGKCVIWCRWVPDIIQITERLGDTCVEYSGRVKQRDREMALWKLENDPGIRHLVGQQQSGGVGLNMTAACNTFYFSNYPSLRLRKQSEDRTHRGGQTRTCSYWDLLVPNSPDTLIMDILKKDYDLALKSLDVGYLQQFL